MENHVRVDMDRRRKQQAEGCGANARRQGLGCYRRAGSGSKESSVLGQMAWFLESQYRPDDWTYGVWTEGGDNKLKDAVQMHGGKDWAAIAALVQGRTKIQSRNRWQWYIIKYHCRGMLS
jgi:hypothetical protein